MLAVSRRSWHSTRFCPAGFTTPPAQSSSCSGSRRSSAAVLTFPGDARARRLDDESLVRGRSPRARPTASERRIYVALVGWVLAAVLPALIVGLSLNADPLCFTF